MCLLILTSCSIPRNDHQAPPVNITIGTSAPVEMGHQETNDLLPIVDKALSGGIRDLCFGGYEWRVLDVQGDNVLIITEDVVELRPYNKTQTNVTWETCDLREYLNSDFLNTFSGEEQGIILETQIDNPNNLRCGTPGGNNTMDKVFLLSLNEADKYFGDTGDYLQMSDMSPFWFSNSFNSSRSAIYDGDSHWWWLRSPGNNSASAARVGDSGSDDGFVHVYGYMVGTNDGGVRPALWVTIPGNSITVQSIADSITEPPIFRRIQNGDSRNLLFGSNHWRVLELQGSRALIITENVIADLPYNFTGTDVTWETSTIRALLNSGSLLFFTDKEQERIIETEIDNPDNLWYGTPGGNGTVDRVFLLSLEEVDKYFGDTGDYLNIINGGSDWLLSNSHDSDRQAVGLNRAERWWLRSPGRGSNYAARVRADGSIDVGGLNVDLYLGDGGIRPALWLNLEP